MLLVGSIPKAVERYKLGINISSPKKEGLTILTLLNCDLNTFIPDCGRQLSIERIGHANLAITES